MCKQKIEEKNGENFKGYQKYFTDWLVGQKGIHMVKPGIPEFRILRIGFAVWYAVLYAETRLLRAGLGKATPSPCRPG